MKTKEAIEALSTVSNDLHDLTLDAVFSKSMIDESKSQTIGLIRSNMNEASDLLGQLMVVDEDTISVFDSIIKECMSSLHEINSNMKSDLIQQDAEDDYAELSAQVVILHEQIERIKNS